MAWYPPHTERRVMFLMLFVTLIQPCLGANLLDAKKFSQTLTNLAIEGLGTSNLQEAFDKIQFTESPVDGSTVIPTLAHDISAKFKEKFSVVKRLKEAVEKSWTTPPSSSPTGCCSVKYSSGLEYDSRFRSKIDLTRICVKVSKSASSNPTHIADEVLTEMKTISQSYPGIKWQYFASEQGMYANFPAFEDQSDCASYDPRFRPFYVETATPEPKDVVLVIDRSGSMSGTRLKLAKEAAKTVLRTMNPRDRIGVVQFSSDPETPVEQDGDGRGCHSQYLADATPINIEYLESYVDSIHADGGTIYSKALARAFDLFKGTLSKGGSARRKVILFLTDGKPGENKRTIIETIKTRNAELMNEVVILTYGMFTNLPILTEMAEQAGQGVVQAPDVKVGKFTYVNNEDSLRSDMATYYDFFSTKTFRNEPIISIPYIDAFGTGLLTSITLPCYHGGKFIGVVGTDISMADLLSDVTYFQKGQSSYAWMADSSGRTMMHPLLPAPSDAFVDPIFMDITALEPEPGFDTVFQSIKVGTSGQTSFKSKRYLARGGQIKDGVTVLEVQSTYYWMSVDKTNFTVGVVVADGEKEELLTSLAVPSGFKFLYHRLDLVRPDEPCVHFSRYASKDTTVVKFGAEAFKDPYGYLGLDETVFRVNAYKSFMTKPGAIGPWFKPGIRDTVIASSTVDKIWFQEKAAYEKFLVWRYFGSSNGVFRITPGTIIAKSFDPTKRPWYHTAVRNVGLVALSTPYIDAFGTGAIITASHTIYRGEPRHQHTTKDQVIGVLGADFPLSYFQKLLTDTYPQCRSSNYECFVLNGAGFLIMHKDFLSPDITARGLEYVHITAKEKDIAQDLLDKGHLKKRQCRNLEKINVENFYELEIPFQGVNTLTSGLRCRQYQLTPVAESNAFLGIKSYDSFCQSKSCISCNSGNTACARGLSVSMCQCPCISRLDFHYCSNEFPASNVSICPVPAPVVSSEEVKDPSIKGLKKCFDPECNKKLDSDSCDGVVGCYWCVRDKYDAPLDKKYCADINSCYGGKEGTRAPGSGNIPTDADDGDDKDSDKGGLSGGAIAGIVIGVIAFIIIAVLIAVKCQAKHKVSKTSHQADVQPVPAPPPGTVSYNPPPRHPYAAPYPPEPGIAMQPNNFGTAPPSYEQSMGGYASPSAPPYNPHYKGSFRHK